jgi:hypothetical protein
MRFFVLRVVHVSPVLFARLGSGFGLGVLKDAGAKIYTVVYACNLQGSNL